MALIKCRECGQPVLSVASLCPHCSVPLGPEPGQSVQADELMHCRHCRELMTRREKLCPHCGRQQGRKAVVVGVSLVAGIILGVGTWIMLADGDGRDSATPIIAAAPARPSITLPAQGPIDTAVALDSGLQSASQRPVPPDSGRQTPAQRTVPLVATISRFAREWANVRMDRNLRAEIVAILRPGQEVAVADRESGWWSVYLGDSLVGFVSADLLGSFPP